MPEGYRRLTPEELDKLTPEEAEQRREALCRKILASGHFLDGYRRTWFGQLLRVLHIPARQFPSRWQYRRVPFSMATTLGAKTLKASSQRMLQILRYSLNGSRRVVSIVDRLVRKKLRKRIEQDFCCLEKR